MAKNLAKKKKIKVAVLMGGVSNERKISLITGKMVVKHLNPSKFQVKVYDTKKDLSRLFFDAQKRRFDIAFIALHGKKGEDGALQGMLELLDVPYTGCGVLASAVGMQKSFSKRLFQAAKIPTPKFIIVNISQSKEKNFWEELEKKVKKRIGFPCVVKPDSSGSSLGVKIVENEKQLKREVESVFSIDQKVIIEEYLRGTEITVGVLGNEEPIVLPVVGIYPKNKFFDFQAKYDPRFCEEIAPAPIPDKQAQKAQKIAKKVYQLLDCRGFSRIDMILKDKTPYVLEINTIPGLTPNSLLPKAAKAAGISFSELLEKIIEFGFKK